MTGDALPEDAAIRPLIEAFYARVRADPELGPVFAAAVTDWDDHHGRLADFWSSVMLTSGRYKGNPLALHMRHAAAMTPARFERWLALWAEVTAERMPAPVAAAMQERAARIAASLQAGIGRLRPGPPVFRYSAPAPEAGSAA
ncbi:group III truncated hemoglobin [Oceanicella sp. SM1341]|uniref:group III truncated hemoglobin n=1 Tax=Oceanicella sp. SM1341 TaxID=1548889 RepID=UPI000E4992B9|nr:group III truncated hemoglobin [Oceanicella sp. SM1341]